MVTASVHEVFCFVLFLNNSMYGKLHENGQKALRRRKGFLHSAEQLQRELREQRVWTDFINRMKKLSQYAYFVSCAQKT